MRELIATLRASSALTAITTEYGTSYEDVRRAASTATSTTSNKLVDTAGAFVVNAVAVGDIVKNTTTGLYALVTAVDSATALSISADIMLSTNGYVIYTRHGYLLNTQGQIFNELQAILDVTAAATDAGDTLDVYIDTSFDAGLTWVNVIHFTQVLGNGGAKQYVGVIKADNPGATAVYATSADAAAGATRQVGFGDRISYRAAGVNTSTVNNSFTFSLKAHLK